jgi:pimeloyl-ACP methyl ester carboxylesterase
MTTYQWAVVDGSRIFYREAGPNDRPTILLLHGFPTSSHMFRNLIPALADRYHLVAPDLPGFGFSDIPDRKEFRSLKTWPRSSIGSRKSSVLTDT